MPSKAEVDERRKRINRIKTIILTVIIVFSVLPTILCIVLFFRMSKLQNQVDDLMHLTYGENVHEQVNINKEKYAYAAEPGEDGSRKEDLSSIQNDANIILDNKNEILKNEEDQPIGLTTNNSNKLDHIENEENNGLETDNNVSPYNVDNKENKGLSTDNSETQDNSRYEDNNRPIIDIDNTNDNLLYNEMQRNVDGKYYEKKVYLTFDDGPSSISEDILDILDCYNVKATFFVIGKTDSKSKRIYQRILDEGHTLGMHSYSHEYDTIYNSLEDFEKDFTKLWDLLYDTIGHKPTIYRFPGGSANRVNDNGMDSFIRFLKEKSMVYYDWNVDNGDATGKAYTKDDLIDNVLSGIAKKKSAIVLMHDVETKKTTLDSLPELLDELILEGAKLLPLDETVTPIQQIRASSIE